MIQKNLCKPTLEWGYIKYVFSENSFDDLLSKRIFNTPDK